MNGQDREALRQSLLPRILAEVPFEGWSSKALLAAGRSLALEAATVERAFPGGPLEAIDYWHERIDADMLAALAQRDLKNMRMRERVALAVRLHLMALEQHREALSRAIAATCLPLGGGLAINLISRTVERIWQAVGDGSFDASWYTKRANLAALYGATLLYWLDDSSQGSTASWAFLERGLDRLMSIAKLTSRLKAATARLPDPLATMRRLRFGAFNG